MNDSMLLYFRAVSALRYQRDMARFRHCAIRSVRLKASNELIELSWYG